MQRTAHAVAATIVIGRELNRQAGMLRAVAHEIGAPTVGEISEETPPDCLEDR